MDGGRVRWPDERIDDLKRRLEHLEGLLMRVSEQVTRMDERIRDMREDIAENTARIKGIRAQFEKAVMEEPLTRARAITTGIVIALVGALAGALATGIVIALASHGH